MKGIDIFCASQSSTSTLGGGTMEEGSSSSSIKLGQGPTLDRYNPIIRDPSRLRNPPPSINDEKQNTREYLSKKKQKKVAAKTNISSKDDKIGNEATIMNWGRRSWSCMNPGGFISPPGSSRYLLSEKTILNVLPPAVDSIPAENSKSPAVREEESGASIQSSSAPPAPSCQVVVLRVSLHCRGCERKMRKHISTMEGVSSFNIDFAARKVTVEGNVTPLEVLASISKVKNAQLWTSPTSPDVGYKNSEMKKPQPTIM